MIHGFLTALIDKILNLKRKEAARAFISPLAFHSSDVRNGGLLKMD
jgi:hypothetical protein